MDDDVILKTLEILKDMKNRQDGFENRLRELEQAQSAKLKNYETAIDKIVESIKVIIQSINGASLESRQKIGELDRKIAALAGAEKNDGSGIAAVAEDE